MTPRRQRSRKPGGYWRLGCLAIASVLVTAACGGTIKHHGSGTATAEPRPLPTQPVPTTMPYAALPNPRAVNRRDATAVSRAAVQVMWTVDAASDRSQLDAYLRARPYMTSAWYAALATEPVGAIPSHWRDHRAYAQVRLHAQAPEDGAGADTATTAHRQWKVTVTPIGRDGWTGRAAHAIAFVTLVGNAEGRWEVSGVSTA